MCADVGALLAEEAVQVDGREATASRYSWILIAGIIVAATVKTGVEVKLVEVEVEFVEVEVELVEVPSSEAGSIRTAKSTLAPHECTK